MSRDATPNGVRNEAAPAYGVPPSGHRLPASTRLGPVVLQVADLERSRAFYARMLGLDSLTSSEGHARLGVLGSAETLLELVERPGVQPVAPRDRLGLFHFAVRVPDRAALAGFARHLGGLGIPVGMSDHAVSEAFYLSDPDGLGIEVYADRPRGQWRKSRNQLVMTTEPLDLGDLLAQAGSESWSGMPTGTDMGHIHLHVGDLQLATRFYHQGLGLDKVVWDYPGALFLSAGGYHHHVGINTWAAGAPPAGPDDARLLSWTLLLPDEAEVERTAASLAAAGHHAFTEEGGRQFARDPWGTMVELVAADG